MNKYQEALSSVLFTMHNRVKPKALGRCEDSNFDLLQELVDRETPKKYEKKEQIVNGISIIHAVCPNCGIIIDEFEHLKGCPYCLQALDWSDEG